MTVHDFWLTIDHQGERDSLEQARLEHLAQQIRSDMKPSDFLGEIEESASIDTDCIKAIQMLFIGADPATCAKVLAKFADAWLDRQSMKLAQQYSK
jgi:hypothetical protein